ncbi:YodC family protein [Mesorhizobium sp. 131-2-5]|uniref:YodC family protein n=1 Tax=Mesorhizobium sp. 131-2-5 TaxID=2744519 RepID=UPI001FD02E27|nr:DUF2158 domain-containing protein [Mesorhizobium sp. 131-2-5]
MPNTFKTGDVVKLKSGGPKMTVSDGAASGMYLCHWFNREWGDEAEGRPRQRRRHAAGRARCGQADRGR